MRLQLKHAPFCGAIMAKATPAARDSNPTYIGGGNPAKVKKR
jgi:hypothetical protein